MLHEIVITDILKKLQHAWNIVYILLSHDQITLILYDNKITPLLSFVNNKKLLINCIIIAFSFEWAK